MRQVDVLCEFSVQVLARFFEFIFPLTKITFEFSYIFKILVEVGENYSDYVVTLYAFSYFIKYTFIAYKRTYSCYLITTSE